MVMMVLLILNMKSFLKVIVFQIGVDVLGFPLIHEHRLKYGTESKFITSNENNRNSR